MLSCSPKISMKKRKIQPSTDTCQLNMELIFCDKTNIYFHSALVKQMAQCLHLKICAA